ncbi:hypothetical protein BK816_02020 [Boudabousia tangfeifanii]|uniref:Capsule synthesis protein CapA domain-containing protein n=1 Tax=Boudabousia tangfeifanii TaxID=1912795 RepID=A0A1D9MJ65_9ACTO|nr:CapA family protein [Boudabousia tangfeifanii]AOZ72220.1 hypothetical protein BK816_02020 [Boudabousia tangfeifanii]
MSTSFGLSTRLVGSLSNRRRLVGLGAVAALSLSLAACSPATPSPSVSPEGGTPASVSVEETVSPSTSEASVEPAGEPTAVPSVESTLEQDVGITTEPKFGSAPESTPAGGAKQPGAKDLGGSGEDVTLTFAATGDMLPHGPLVKAARRGDGSVHLMDRMVGVEPYIKGADLALCHLEVPFAPRDNLVKDYPQFAAPPSLIGDLKELGYDGCSTASNHSWDQKQAGFDRTLQLMANSQLGTAGTNLTPEMKPYQLYRLERAGRTITIGHVSLTYGHNRWPIAQLQREPWRLNLDDIDRAIADAKAAKAAGADVVIASMHTGVEWDPTPSTDQKGWSQRFADSGVVDLVIGHHPHVAQTAKAYPRPGRTVPMWSFYGLGNMISAQVPSQGKLTQVGVLALPTLTLNARNEVIAASATWEPLVLDRAGLRLYTASALEAHKGPAPRTNRATLLSYLQAGRSQMGSVIKEASAPPVSGGKPPVALPR